MATNSATLIIGPTGSGKSSLAYTLGEYLWLTFQKVLYYYNCDGGGFPAKVQEGIALGFIKGFRMRTRDPGDGGLAFETCYRAAQGWWPRRINPQTCEVEPGVEMVPPIAKRLQMVCPNGHILRTVVTQSQLTPGKCPTCQVMVTTQNMQITPTMTYSKGFEDRGGVFFDGLTSMLSWEMMELGQRAGRLELKGEEGAIGGKVVSGDLKFGGVTRSHVGFAQTRGEELCHLSMGIPNLLVPPVFTALTMETTDDAALSIVGPKIAGRAKTDEAGQWVGNCWETAKVPAETGSGEQFVLFLSEFTDAQGRRHLLKHRGAPGTMPDVLKDPPNGTDPFSQFNLGLAFKMLEEALSSGVASAKQRYPDAPGVVDGIMEYGDGGQPQPAAPPTAGTAPTVAAAPVAAGGPRRMTVGQPVPAAPPPQPPKPNGQAGEPVAVAETPEPAPVAVAAAPVLPAAVKPRTRGPSKPKAAAQPAVAPVQPDAPVVATTPAPAPAQVALPMAPAPMPAAQPARPASTQAPAARVGVAPPAGARPPVVTGPVPRPPAAAPRPPAMARPNQAPPTAQPAPRPVS